MTAFALTGTRGDTNQYNVSVTSNGVVLNLTGCLLWFTGKYSVQDADPGVFQVRSDVGNTQGSITITDVANGKATVVLNPIATTGLPSKQILVCDLQLKDSTGKITTVAEGTIQFAGDVTIVTT